MSERRISAQELATHRSPESLWIVIHGKVYDVTAFVAEHPGGRKVLERAVGTDATPEFDKFHSVESVIAKHAHLVVGTFERAPAVMARPADLSSTTPFENLSFLRQHAHSPYYKASHAALAQAARAWIETNITPHIEEWEKLRRVPKDIHRKCAQAGLLPLVVGSPWPSSADAGAPIGLGTIASPAEVDAFHELVFLDELARTGSGGVLWGLIEGLAIGLPPVLHGASEPLRSRIAGECLRGDAIIALAITEPHAGSDVARVQCDARKTADGRHFVVNGEKKWITNGAWADYFTVLVRTGAPDGGATTSAMDGLSLLLIERTRPGVKTRQMLCSGMWASGTAYVTFEDVQVPVENLIGQEGKGFRYTMLNFNHERWGFAVQATCMARVCLHESWKHAMRRKTFGKRLIEHDVIRNKLAHMSREVESTQCWIDNITHEMVVLGPDESRKVLAAPIALLKAHAGIVLEHCAREAAQIFGGLSYTQGGQAAAVERIYREVRAYAIPAGSEEYGGFLSFVKSLCLLS